MSLAVNMHRKSSRGPRHQLLWWFLLSLVLVPTVLVWVAVGSSFFGYRVVDAWGTSMEPVFRNGDALWVKLIDIADARVGSILVIVPPSEESITHRVVKIEPLSNGSYFLTTKGDANHFIEEWEIGADWTVAVMVVRVPFGGYVLEFLASIVWQVLISSALITLVVIWIRQRRMARGSG